MNLQRLVDAVSAERGIPADDICGSSRLGPIVRARREAMRRMYVDYGRRTPEIARFFGVNATSVRHHLMAAGVSLKEKSNG